MSVCPDKEMLLHGYLDGELDAANTMSFESHLETCQGCTLALARFQALRDRLAETRPGYRAPEGLRDRIEGQLNKPRSVRRIQRAAPWAMSGAFAALAASLAVVMIQADVTALDRQLVAGHVRSTLASHLVDVETSDRHVVKPWFNGRVSFAPPVIDLAESGYPLVGGRLDYIDGQVVSALVYRRNRHVINVFIRPQEQGFWPRRESTILEGYAVVHWRAQGLDFWAVSDMESGDLAAFRKAFLARAPV